MSDHHNINVPGAETDSRPRKLLFTIMQNVHQRFLEEDPTVDLRALNNVALNIARDVFMKKAIDQKPDNALTSPDSKTNSVDRDSLLFGGRTPAMIGVPRPQITSQNRVPESSSNGVETRPSFDLKSDPQNMPKWSDVSASSVSDTPIAESELTKRLAGRDDDALLASILRTPQPRTDFGESFTSTHAESDDTHLPENSTLVHAPDVVVLASNETRSMIVSRPSNSQTSTSTSDTRVQPHLAGVDDPRVVDKFIIVNGFDRYWQVNPQRHQFTVRVGGTPQQDPLVKDLQGSYRNVHHIQITRLIIPMEISPPPCTVGQSATSIIYGSTNNGSTMKGTYLNAVSLSFPYVTISIDGLDDIYDGTNSSARNAFCHMVYTTSYKAPNGRGFVILEPMQDERKLFIPCPLASLSRLDISVRRPSGALFNESLDDQTIMQIMYEPFNPKYLRVVLVNYFDMNDFYVGDSVMLQDYLAVQSQASTNSAWMPDASASYRSLNAFINRSEGHEIVELGLPNESGFFRSFCILAPSKFDANIGSIVVDAPVINAINEINSPSFPCPLKPFGGAILNMSVQNVITFRIGILTGYNQTEHHV